MVYRPIKSQAGEINVLLLPLILVTVLFLGAGGFGAWAYMSRQDYKDNVDAKIATAVASAEERVKAADKKLFLEEEKKPLRVFAGPDTYRSVTVHYPKTWSVYSAGSGGQPVDVFFHPNVVPESSKDAAFALRTQVVERSYASVVKQFDSKVRNGSVKVKPYKFAKVPSVIGVRVDGEIVSKKQGSMVIVPLGDKTLQIWTEAPSFVADFNNNILPNVSFNP